MTEALSQRPSLSEFSASGPLLCRLVLRCVAHVLFFQKAAEGQGHFLAMRTCVLARLLLVYFASGNSSAQPPVSTPHGFSNPFSQLLALHASAGAAEALSLDAV